MFIEVPVIEKYDMAEHFFETPAMWVDHHQEIQQIISREPFRRVNSYEFRDVFRLEISHYGEEHLSLRDEVRRWCLVNLEYIPYVWVEREYTTYDGQSVFTLCFAEFGDLTDATLFRVAWKS